MGGRVTSVSFSLPEGACCPEVRMTALIGASGVEQVVGQLRTAFPRDSEIPGPLHAALHQLLRHAECLRAAAEGREVRVERVFGPLPPKTASDDDLPGEDLSQPGPF